MTLLILMVGIAAMIATVVGYVAWRDRHRRGSFVDPSISRDALVQADQQAVRGRLADAGMPSTDFISHGPGYHSRANRT
jgi:hypothetical protein